MNAQEIVAANVAARGYRDGWTAEQFVARQLAKLTEELSEVVCDVAFPSSNTRGVDWRVSVSMAGLSGRWLFDDRPAWENISLDDPDAIRAELADMQVVLFAAAQALDFDIAQAAIDKSSADVARGVR